MKKDPGTQNAPPLSPRLALQPDQWQGRTRTAIRPPPRVNRFVGKIAKPAFRKFGFAEPHILAHWEAIVGTGLASFAQPVKLSFASRQKRQGLLTIQVSGAAGLEIQHLEPQILERINSYYGAPTVGRLRIVRSPARRQNKTLPRAPRRQAVPLSPRQRETIESHMSALTYEGVEGALRRLGENILDRGKQAAPKPERP